MWTAPLSQNLLVKNFKWIKNISRLDESFIKSYKKQSGK